MCVCACVCVRVYGLIVLLANNKVFMLIWVFLSIPHLVNQGQFLQLTKQVTLPDPKQITVCLIILTQSSMYFEFQSFSKCSYILIRAFVILVGSAFT